MLTYFVAFAFPNSRGGLATGNCAVTRAKPLSSMEDIRELGRTVANNHRIPPNQLTVIGVFPLQG
jgi:hypothetical protein